MWLPPLLAMPPVSGASDASDPESLTTECVRSRVVGPACSEADKFTCAQTDFCNYSQLCMKSSYSSCCWRSTISCRFCASQSVPVRTGAHQHAAQPPMHPARCLPLARSRLLAPYLPLPEREQIQVCHCLRRPFRVQRGSEDGRWMCEPAKHRQVHRSRSPSIDDCKLAAGSAHLARERTRRRCLQLHTALLMALLS